MSHYIIGDVQGCYAELRALLKKIAFNPEVDHLWLCGDIINAGPQNVEVLRFLSNLPSGQVIVTLGNHDLHALAVYYGVRAYAENDTFEDILLAPDVAILMQWLRMQSLMHYDPYFQCLLVHAGVHPDWSLEVALSRVQHLETCLHQTPKEFLKAIFGITQAPESTMLRDSINVLMCMRFLDENNQLELRYKGGIKNMPPGLAPWFCKSPLTNNLPLWKDIDIFFGHWAALEGKSDVPHIYPLDTGCVWGRQLTAFCLETREYHQVTGQKYRKI